MRKSLVIVYSWIYLLQLDETLLKPTFSTVVLKGSLNYAEQTNTVPPILRLSKY